MKQNDSAAEPHGEDTQSMAQHAEAPRQAPPAQSANGAHPASAPPQGTIAANGTGGSEPNGKTKRQLSPQARAIGLLVLAAALIYGVIWGVGFWHYSQAHTSTDDAYLTSDIVQVTPQVNGNIQKLMVKSNQHVTKGDLLFQLDDSTYQADIASAEANLQVARAGAYGADVNVGLTSATGSALIQQAQGGVGQAQSGIAVAGGGVAQAQAAAGAALAEVERSRAASANSQVGIQSAQAGVTTAQAGLQSALAARAHAVDMMHGAQAQVATAQAAVRAAQANITSAQATADRSARDQQRFAVLYSQDATSAQQLDVATATATSARAQLESVRQALAQAQEVVNQRQSDLASAQDAIQAADAAMAQARSQTVSARDGVLAAQATARQAQAQLQESQQNVMAAQAQLQIQRQNVRTAQAKLTQTLGQLSQAQTTPRQVTVQQANARTASAKIKQAEAALRDAQIALQRTRITAPVSGTISANTAEVGQQVAIGQSVMVIIPDNDVWVTANFKETQLQDMQVKQPVEIEVDTFPGHKFEGYVESLSAGTGATFALLPPDNATGNFTKVVQRLPVRIFFNPKQPYIDRLRAGLSAVVTVKTK